MLMHFGLIALSLVGAAPGARASCDQDQRDKLLHCYMDLLDDWAFNMWSIKKTLTTMNCTLVDQMNKCIQISGCPMSDAVDVSSTLTELLTYNRGAGTFLHSFLALAYACSEPGRRIVEKHKECLHNQGDDLYLIAIVDVLNDQFLSYRLKEQKGESNHDHDLERQNPCEILSGVARQAQVSAEQHCEAPDAGYLACKTVSHPFQAMYPNLVGIPKCGEICHMPKEEEEEEVRPHEAIPGSSNGVADGQDGPSGGAQQTSAKISAIFLPAIFWILLRRN